MVSTPTIFWRLDFQTAAQLLLLLLLLLAEFCGAQVGVNWGTQVSHPLFAPDVVKMLTANKFTRVKLFEADASILQALRGSELEVTVGIPNSMLEMLSMSEHAANNWVKGNITRYLIRQTSISYLAVGEEPLQNGVSAEVVLGALRNIRAALNRQSRTREIKTTVPFSLAVVTSNTSLPSGGKFRNVDQMKLILEFLSSSSSPFAVNIYPFISKVLEPNFPLEYAFFDNNLQPQQDQGKSYNNAFDASFDSVVAALKDAGFPNMPIIVGGSGWPTDCEPDANPDNAHRYNQALVKRISEGTPVRPGPLHAYIFDLVDEDLKVGNAYEKHWGIFTYDGQPKYLLQVTDGGPSELEMVPNVKYQFPRWCIYDESKTATDDVLRDRITRSCQQADCSALGEGGSCHYLTLSQAASYAFNSNYQFHDQATLFCDPDFGIVVSEKPAYGNCQFLQQIRVNGVAERHQLRWLLLVVVLSVFLLF